MTDFSITNLELTGLVTTDHAIMGLAMTDLELTDLANLLFKTTYDPVIIPDMLLF